VDQSTGIGSSQVDSRHRFVQPLSHHVRQVGKSASPVGVPADVVGAGEPAEVTTKAIFDCPIRDERRQGSWRRS
jgi:hypothetical protein